MIRRLMMPSQTRSPARQRRNSTAAQEHSDQLAAIMWLRPSGVVCSVSGGQTSRPST